MTFKIAAIIQGVYVLKWNTDLDFLSLILPYFREISDKHQVDKHPGNVFSNFLQCFTQVILVVISC